ncbi:MAG: phosphoglycerate kinase [Aquiluna sp.]|jgi:phosphoglycerate kinase
MLRTIKEAGELRGKRVLLRCDFNVPLDGDRVTDDGRIRASIPTINYLVESGARVIIISHLGRPEGKPEAKYSLLPAARRLAELLGQDVKFATDTVGNSAKDAVEKIQEGQVIVLENLRFNGGEASKDASSRNEFARELAALADLLVSDGFGVVHRKQASVYELAEVLPSFAGLLIEAELKVLEKLTINPERPYTVVLGGSKVSDKLGVIEHLLPKVDRLLIGGGMLFTFLAAKGFRVGKSLLEQDQLEKVNGFIAKAQELGVALELPSDIVVADKFAADAAFEVVGAQEIESSRFAAEGIGLDIGPETAKNFSNLIESSKTVFWNGPMGVFEFPNFAQGTLAIAKALSGVTGTSVVGGGDSAAAVRMLGFSENAFSHISTGGGASLEFLEGKSLPGLEVLSDR